MSIKSAVRNMMDKSLHKYGYTLTKTLGGLDRYNFILDQKEVPLDASVRSAIWRAREEASQRSAAEAEDGGTSKASSISDAIPGGDLRYTINWIIPPFGKGSGGHTTLFRTISHLTKMGFHSRIFLYDGENSVPDIDWKQVVVRDFGFPFSDEEIYNSIANMPYADAAIATSWITAYVLEAFHNCTSRFLFVQDFEPYFYPMGSAYYLAENTYKLGMRGITAGDWLAEKLHKEYGMQTQAFGFAYDPAAYHEYPEHHIHAVNVPDAGKGRSQELRGAREELPPGAQQHRVFFYARPHTERRAFELGVMALRLLNQQIPELTVVMAGQDIGAHDFGFHYENQGILTPEKLSETYGSCELCLVLSMTNLSLVPLEVMASGSVVVSNRGANNEWLLNDSNSILVENDPWKMADTMAKYLQHPYRIEALRRAGMQFAEQFSWEHELDKVGMFIRESVEEDAEE